MAQIEDLLHLDAITVSGSTVRENIDGAEIINPEVIRPASAATEARLPTITPYDKN